MLMEIRCDDFKENDNVRKPITFYKGLNVVLGNESGTNSVGKSTFLMILDFVFGGDDYIHKSKEVHKPTNVGPHVIKFKFEFDGKPYYFSRATDEDEYNKVIPCDSNYNPIPEEPLTISKYWEFLREKYGLTEEGQTWRGSVTRFIRVDRRETLDTDKPLKSYKGESDHDGIVALIRLFGNYHAIEEQIKARDAAENDEKAYKDALKHEFIPAVKNDTEYKKNKERIITLQAEINDLAERSSKGLLELTSLQAEQIAELRDQISSFRRQRSIMESQKTSIERSRSEKKLKSFQSDFNDLLLFFPQMNVERLNGIEEFHRQLSSILNGELRESEKNLDAMIALANEEIKKREHEQLRISQIPNVTKATLERYAELQKEMLELQSANDAYDKKAELKKKTDTLAKTANDLTVSEMRYIETKLNSMMDEMNETLYDIKIKPPRLFTLSADAYDFKTEDDGGTGMRYKGMILLDIAVLRATKLPFIIHDSVLLPNIENEVIDRILLLYKKYAEELGKQIFVAVDKISTQKSLEILAAAQVLHLSRGGNELFGRAWNRKTESSPNPEVQITETKDGQMKLDLDINATEIHNEGQPDTGTEGE